MADAKRLKVGFPFQHAGGQGAHTNFNLNQSGDKVGFVFSADEAIVITRLGVRVSNVAGTSPTYKLSLQGVSSTGVADGTIKGGVSPASVSFAPSAAGWVWKTLDNSYTCARGENLAVVFEYASGTVDGSNNSGLTYVCETSATRLPFAYTIDNGGAAAKTTNAWPVFGYASATVAYGGPLSAHQDLFTGATGTSIGTKFTLPSGWGSTYKVAGLIIGVSDFANGTGQFVFKLWQGGNASDLTVLQDVTVDTAQFASITVSMLTTILFDEATLSTLSFGSTYRLTMEYSTAGRLYLQAFDVGTASDLDAYAHGQDFLYTARTGGNWTDTTTRRPILGLILSDITPPSGGGSGVSSLGTGLF